MYRPVTCGLVWKGPLNATFPKWLSTTFLEKQVICGPLTDTFGRSHTYLRISVAERCNLRYSSNTIRPSIPLLPALPQIVQTNLAHLHFGKLLLTNARHYSEEHEPRSYLTHVNQHGKASMVDILPKPITIRTAKASATVKVGSLITKMISENALKKGDVLSIAQISGIIGAKKTSEIIPLCHNINLTKINVTAALNVEREEVTLLSEIQCEGRTGVEMEALTAVSVAALTIYDMCKAVNRNIEITNISLISKTGGKSDDFAKEDVKVRDYDHRPITRLSPYVGPM